jgi:two-component system nitrogen regulation response regulator GlnG
MSRLAWPGNVRQLENTCRWLTVMAPSQDIRIDDLPPELRAADGEPGTAEKWQDGLRRLIEQSLARGESNILEQLNPEFERILLQAALNHTRGHKQDAAKKLGWGRNTLTRKLKELGIE